MSEPVDYKPSGFVAPCRNCGGMAKPVLPDQVQVPAATCLEPRGQRWSPWMCRFLGADRPAGVVAVPPGKEA